jgi:purine-binding chemotaxis protein CheW
VDAVNEVLEIAAAEIEPPPAFGARIRGDFLAGMGKVAERFVIILNVDKVLSEAELSLLGQVEELAS